jgi:hypothetical protein
MSKNNKISLNSEELKSFLAYINANNAVLIGKNLPAQTVNVEGEAGGGKTSTIIQFANEMNMEVIRKNLAELEDVSDLVGYPCKEHELVKGDLTKWVTEGTITQYIQAGYKPTDEKRMTHAAPEWIQGKTKPVILLLDDYSRASEKFIQATMTLLENQTYNNWSLPKGSFVILTSNPDNGNYSVSTMDSAQKTRVINVNYKFDAQVWARYAEKTGIDGRCINYLLLHPELMKEESGINARTVTMFFNSLMSIDNFSNELPLIQQLGEATTNPEFTIMFTTFINNKLDKLVTPKNMLLQENESYILGEIKSCIGQGDSYRADIASVLATRLINFTVEYAEKHTINQAIIDRLITFATVDLFTNDLKYIIIKNIIKGNKQKFQKLMLNTEVIKMAGK